VHRFFSKLSRGFGFKNRESGYERETWDFVAGVVMGVDVELSNGWRRDQGRIWHWH
jgi:hypothetical protein